MNPTKFSPRHFLQWLSLLLLTLFVALVLGWASLAKVDFAYRWLHDHTGIAGHIAQYAPLNYFKPSFELTDSAERARLFHGIVESIHQQGKGLAQLTYHDPHGQAIAPLLTEAETIHLQDVARLLDTFTTLAMWAVPLWAILSGVLLYYRQPLPRAKQWLHYIALLALPLGGVLSFGATEVFYQLHVWVFPAGHQWFFYYEESLMSTMMQAPVLFGYIAMMLGGLAAAFTLLLLGIYHAAIQYRIQHS